MEEETFWWIFILMAMKLPFSPSVRPIRKRRAGKQNFTQVYPGQTSAAFPRYFNSQRFPHCSVQTILMMSSTTSSWGSVQSLSNSTFFALFFKLKKWHMCKKTYQKGPQHACSTYLYKHLLQQLWNWRRELAPFFVIVRNLMMGTLGKDDR